MNINRETLKEIILKAVEFYNGFLEENEKKKVDENMRLDESYGIDYNDFGAIMLLVFAFLRKKDIWFEMDKYDERLMAHRHIDRLVDFLIGVI